MPIGSLVAYRYLLPFIGSASATFFFILFLTKRKKLGHYSWKGNILFSFLTAVVCYYFFQIFPQIPMPGEILGI